MELASGTRPLAADQQVRLLISCLTVLIDRNAGDTPVKQLLRKNAEAKHLADKHKSDFGACIEPDCLAVIDCLLDSSERSFAFLLSDLPPLSHLKLRATTPIAGKVQVYLQEETLVKTA